MVVGDITFDRSNLHCSSSNIDNKNWIYNLNSEIMKLIDCFMYFDEDLVLEIRLNTLYDIVDKFVIVEANKTTWKK